MEEKGISWKDYHHQIYQIYHGIIAVTLVPFALLFLEWDSAGQRAFSMNAFGVIYVMFVLGITGYVCWYVWKGEKVKYELSDSMSLRDKLKEFKRKNLMKYGLLAFGGVLSALAMWLQPTYFFVIAYFAVLVQYSFLRPSEDKFVRDMKITKKDRDRLHARK